MVLSSGTGGVLLVAAVSQEMQDFRMGKERGVHCLVTGMGQRAGELVRQRLTGGDIRLVVSTGFAGGTRPGFHVGDLVMASEVIDAGTGERRRPEAVYYGLNGMASMGTFVTVNRVLTDPETKAEAGTKYGAIAVDMETSAVAEAAEQAGVPWVAVRTILDPMETALAVGSGAEAVRCFWPPRRWKELAIFLYSLRVASKSLGEGLHLLVERFRSQA